MKLSNIGLSEANVNLRMRALRLQQELIEHDIHAKLGEIGQLTFELPTLKFELLIDGASEECELKVFVKKAPKALPLRIDYTDDNFAKEAADFQDMNDALEDLYRAHRFKQDPTDNSLRLVAKVDVFNSEEANDDVITVSFRSPNSCVLGEANRQIARYNLLGLNRAQYFHLYYDFEAANVSIIPSMWLDP